MPADREALLHLAERVEKAEGPSRELDGLIWLTTGLIDEAHCQRWCGMDGRSDLTRTMFIQAWAPDYTSDLDAALKLVPDAHTWAAGDLGENDDLWACVTDDAEPFPDFAAEAATPALALCAAALRALAATTEGAHG